MLCLLSLYQCYPAYTRRTSYRMLKNRLSLRHVVLRFLLLGNGVAALTNPYMSKSAKVEPSDANRMSSLLIAARGTHLH